MKNNVQNKQNRIERQLSQPKKSCKLNPIASAQMMMLMGGVVGTVLVCATPAYADTAVDLLEMQKDDQALAQADSAIAVSALPTIKVVAQAPNYAGGQIAKKSQLGFLGDKSTMETPFSTVSYTDKYVDDKQAKDITEVIASTDPAVFTNGASGGWNESYYIRGFSSSSSDMSMNGLFGVTPLYRTSPEMFEQVEVLKGPSALLNGMPPKGSVGGTVNLVTKRAADEPLTRLTTTYMSDSQFGGHVDIGRRFGNNKQFGVRFNGVYRDGQGAVNNQDKNTEQFSLGLDWSGEKARVSLDAYHALDEVIGVDRGLNLGPAVTTTPKPPKAGTLLNPDWGYVENKDKGIMVRGEYDLNDYIMAYAAYGQSNTEYKYSGVGGPTVNNNQGDFTAAISQLFFEKDKKSADAGFKGEFETGAVKHQWVVNGTYYRDEESDFGYRTVPGTTSLDSNIYHPVFWSEGPAFTAKQSPLYDTTLSTSSYGIADTLSFNDEQVQLTLGARYQTVKATSSFNQQPEYSRSTTTPGAALLVKATDHISVYANYIEGLSTGGQAPITAENAGEIFAPQKTKQTELGLKFDHGRFNHSLAVFEIKKPDSNLDIISNYYTANGEQRNRGIEWTFVGEPIENIRLMGGLSYLDAELTKTNDGTNEGNMATGVPKRQAKLGVEWDKPFTHGVLTLNGNVNMASKQYINQENTLSVKGRTLLDVGARYATEIEDHAVTIRAGINNVTNEAYWGKPQITNLTLGAPRTYLLSASYDF